MSVKQNYGDIEVWINNAATCENKRNTLSQFTYDEVENIISLNVCGTLYGCKAASEVMCTQAQGGKIINIDGCGSMGEMIPGYLAYSTSKSSILYMSRFLDTELKCTNVQVHTISPGIINTDFISNIHNESAIFQSFVQEPEVVASIMVNMIESVNGVQTLPRIISLLLPKENN